jgi:hypothetical protein
VTFAPGVGADGAGDILLLPMDGDFGRETSRDSHKKYYGIFFLGACRLENSIKSMYWRGFPTQMM